MNIGIAAPIEVSSLQNHLSNLTENDLTLGLGGTAINVLIDGFIKAGHNVTVFTLDPTIQNKYVLEGPNLKIIFGHFRKKSRLKWLDFCRVEFLQIKGFIEDEKSNIDIVNAHWSYEFAIGSILTKIPHLVTFRDDSITILKLTKHPYRLTRLLMDFWVRKWGANFSYNSFYLKSLIKLPGNAIPNPIRSLEIMQARSFPTANRTRKICFIANGWDFRKNPEAAIEAFALIQSDFANVQLHLIGSGFEPIGGKYQAIILRGLGDAIKFRGALKHSELMKELENFDIMLHTAREESFGNNLIEAMAKGIPVIAGLESGAVPWVLDGGKAGCLTNIEDPKQIASCLKLLLSSPYDYEKFSQNGIENLKTRFTQEIVCDIYVREFAKILANDK